VTGAPLGRSNGGPRRRRHRSNRGCLVLVIAAIASATPVLAALAEVLS